MKKFINKTQLKLKKGRRIQFKYEIIFTRYKKFQTLSGKLIKAIIIKMMIKENIKN